MRCRERRVEEAPCDSGWTVIYEASGCCSPIEKSSHASTCRARVRGKSFPASLSDSWGRGGNSISAVTTIERSRSFLRWRGGQSRARLGGGARLFICEVLMREIGRQ